MNLFVGGLNDCFKRTPNRKVYYLSVGPQRLEDICIDLICKLGDHYATILQSSKTKGQLLLSLDLEEKIKDNCKLFFPEEAKAEEGPEEGV